MKKILELKNVSISYEKAKNVVNDISFSIKESEILTLLGVNGSGKSTTISAICGMQETNSGSIEICGQNINKDINFSRHQIGLVPQELINYAFFTVNEILKFNAGYFNVKNAQDRIDYLLQRLHLYDKKHAKIKHLSGGMKRRILIAKALLHSPKLLILDEPTAGVDVQIRHSLYDFFREIKKSGTSILLTTHYMEEAAILSDSAVLLHGGNIVRSFNKKSILESEEHFYHIELMDKNKIDLNNINTHVKSSIKIDPDNENTIIVHSTDTLGKVLETLKVDNDNIKKIETKTPNIEDMFIDLTK